VAKTDVSFFYKTDGSFFVIKLVKSAVAEWTNDWADIIGQEVKLPVGILREYASQIVSFCIVGGALLAESPTSPFRLGLRDWICEWFGFYCVVASWLGTPTLKPNLDYRLERGSKSSTSWT